MKTGAIIFVNLIIFTPFFSYFADSFLFPALTLVSLMLRQNQRPQSAHCPFPGCMCTDAGQDGMTAYPPRKLSTYDSSEPLRYASHSVPPPPLSSSSSGPILPMRSAYTWDDREREDIGSPQASSSASASLGGSPARKHARTWDHEVSILLYTHIRLLFTPSYRDLFHYRDPGTRGVYSSISLFSEFFSFTILLTERDKLQDPPIRKRRAGSVSRSPPMHVS